MPTHLLGASADKMMQVKGIDKRKFTAVRSIADGALENLQAFIKYRKSLKL